MLKYCRISIIAACCWPLLSFGVQEEDLLEWNGLRVHPTRILAKYKEPQGEGAEVAVQAVRNAGLQVKSRIGLVPGLVVLDADGEGRPIAPMANTGEAKAEQLAKRLEALEESGLFDYVEPDYIHDLDLAPSDSAFLDGTLWGLRNTGQRGGVPGADIDAERAWDLTTGSTNVIVAVIDTGIRYTHQDLAGNMWRNPGEIPNNGLDDDQDGYIDNVFGVNTFAGTGDPMDDHSHGSHVAGTIGAVANNGAPHVGVAWKVRLMAIKAAGAQGFFPVSALVEGLDFAVKKGAQISNNSYGGFGFSFALRDSIVAARDAGHLFVASAGNESVDNDGPIRSYPASHQVDNIISVAALDRFDRLADFSNFGATNVHVGAPGVSIFSSTADSNTSYDSFDGTSMAAPHVAGVAALVLAAHPTAVYSELRDRVFLSAVSIPSLTGRVATQGRVNAFEAISLSGDGILEIAVNPAPGSALLRGTTEPIFVRVSDLFGITNATVSATVVGVTNLVFANDGQAPDQLALDAVYSANLALPDNLSSVTLDVSVSAPGKNSTNILVTYDLLSPPVNDNLAKAIKLNSAGEMVTGHNKFATMEAGEPAHAGVATAAKSLWWDFSPAASGPVLVDPTGSLFDTVVAVYTGNEGVANLRQIAAANDTPNSLQGHLTFNATAGTTYHIVVAGVNTNQFGSIRLRVEPNGEPDTTGPFVRVISPLSGTVVTTNQIIITGEAFDPPPNASGVSDVFVQRQADLVPTRAAGTTNWSSVVLLQEGFNLIQVTALDYANNRSVTEEIGVTYRIPEAANDLLARANQLSGPSGTVVARNNNASKEFLEPFHAGNEGGKSLWWKWTAPAHGVLLLSTRGSDFDTLLAVYTGNRMTNLVKVAANDDTPEGGSFSEIVTAVEANQEYRIVVDGFGGASGVVELQYDFNPVPVFNFQASALVGGAVTPTSGNFPVNATVLVTAQPERHFEFRDWRRPDGTTISHQNPLVVVMRSDTNVVARFGERVYSDSFESGDLSRLAWEISGDQGWFVQSDVVQTDSARPNQFAVRSGKIGDHSVSRLKLVHDMRAGTGAFDLKVSSEQNWDTLQFVMNGQVQKTWSGEVPWSTHTFEVPAGEVTLEWIYQKDGSRSMGLDGAFLDFIDLPLVLPVTERPVLTLTEPVDGMRRLEVSGQAKQQYEIQVSEDLEDWNTVAVLEADGQGRTSYTDPASLNEPVRFYRVIVP